MPSSKKKKKTTALSRLSPSVEPLTKQFNIRLTEGERQRLDRVAKADGFASASALARHAIVTYKPKNA